MLKENIYLKILLANTATIQLLKTKEMEKELQEKGFKPATIARKLEVAKQIVTKYFRLDTLPERSSKLRNDYHKYDRFVEQEAAKGLPLSSIYKDVCTKGFSGNLPPFYDHYRYLFDGHHGFRSKKAMTHIIKEKTRDERSALMPPKEIAAIVRKSVMGKELNEAQGQLISMMSQLDWFRLMHSAAQEFYSIITGNETSD